MKYQPIVTIDFRVYAWTINHKVKPLMKAGLLDEKGLNKFIKALWAYSLNRGPDFLDPFPHRVVVVTDKKDEGGDYWRTTLMREDERITKAWVEYLSANKRRKKPKSTEYKGNRSGRDDITDIINIGRNYVNKYLGTIYEYPGFEAMIGPSTVYQLKREAYLNGDEPLGNRTLFLSTVDRDWSQLVDDEMGIYLSNYRKPSPRERFQNRLVDNQGVIDHTEHYSEHTIEHPNQLRYVKKVVGDSGDNLPPGSPVEYFDLIDPPLEIKGKIVEKLKEDLTSLEDNRRLDHMTNAQEYIESLGFPHLL